MSDQDQCDTSAASPVAFETVPFDVTVRVSDVAVVRLTPAELRENVQRMIVAQVADQVGVPRSEVDYDRLTVTRVTRRSLREEWFTTKGTWIRRVPDGE